jgi:TolA-binding protein
LFERLNISLFRIHLSCALFLLITMFVSGIMGCSSVEDTEEDATLSDSAAREIEDYINARLDVVKAMPKHPESKALYEHVISRWRYDTGASEATIAWRLAIMLPDSPLGLYAFSNLLENPKENIPDEEQHRYLETMIAEHPDTRVACFAFDQLLKAMDDTTAKDACEEAITQYGEGRLGIFACIRLADYFDNLGELGKAAEYRLLAWQSDASRGSQVYDKLFLYWQGQGAWYWSLLFPQSLLDSPALDGLKARALSELRRYDLNREEDSGNVAEDNYNRFIAELRKGGAAVMRGNLDEAAGAFQTALDLMPDAGLSEAETTDYGLALFLLDMLPGNNESRSDSSLAAQDFWTIQARLREIQTTGLAYAEKGFESYPVLLKGHQRLNVAQVYRNRAQPGEAAQWLEKQISNPGLSPASRLDAVTLLADIYNQDLNTPQESARVYLACAELEDNPEYSFQAALQYYKLNVYHEADTLLSSLLSKDEAQLNERRADILYLSGLCRLQSGNVSGAETALNTLIKSYPKSKLAPDALLLLAQQASVSRKSQEMRELLERIESEYGDSSAARKAKYYLEQLRRQD